MLIDITLSPSAELMLILSCGFFWLMTYVEIIRKGFTDRTYGMPFLALCANITWEFIFAFVFRNNPPLTYINVLWFLFDVIIFYQFIRYGWKSLSTFFRQNYYPIVILVLIVCYISIMLITGYLNDHEGKYTAFTSNLLMSILYCEFLHKRKNLDGQSLALGVYKMLGTFVISIVCFSNNESNWYLTFLYVAILAFDLIYIKMVFDYAKRAVSQIPYAFNTNETAGRVIQ